MPYWAKNMTISLPEAKPAPNIPPTMTNIASNTFIYIFYWRMLYFINKIFLVKQNNNMNSKIVVIMFSIIFASLSVGCVFPYPMTTSTILSSKDQQEINDYYEGELFLETGTVDVSVVNLDWFDVVNDFFTKYKTVRVIDIKSQREYFVQRLGGYNHADVQTIDKANTKIFKEIYGGEWSWVRRPVWVEINGKFVAGSTNGMPHGFSILDNGEGGHTCIHFLNSKTHGTKKVDPDHQNAVNYAYKNGDLLNQYLWNKSSFKK